MTSCMCDECKQMCQRPCWPTPEEAKKLIDAGYASRLMEDYWYRSEGDIKILCPALKGYENRFTPFWPIGQCTFQDENGMCELHDKGLKPLEGRESLCHDRTPENLRDKIVAIWDSSEAQKLVEEWEKDR